MAKTMRTGVAVLAAIAIKIPLVVVEDVEEKEDAAERRAAVKVRSPKSLLFNPFWPAKAAGAMERIKERVKAKAKAKASVTGVLPSSQVVPAQCASLTMSTPLVPAVAFDRDSAVALVIKSLAPRTALLALNAVRQ